jgi:hypothetical protein
MDEGAKILNLGRVGQKISETSWSLYW